MGVFFEFCLILNPDNKPKNNLNNNQLFKNLERKIFFLKNEYKTIHFSNVWGYNNSRI